MILHTKTRRAIFARAAVLAALAFLSIAVVAPAFAQYTLTSLVTTSQDPNLVNGWGMAYATGGPFWIADEGTGKSR